MLKIKLTQNLMSILPNPKDRLFILYDSCYICKNIFKAHEKLTTIMLVN